MQVHFFAAAHSAAGIAQLSVPLAQLSSATLGALIEYLGQSLEGTTPSGLTLAQVMEQCSFLVNGARSDTQAPLQDADRVDVLPPFAGG